MIKKNLLIISTIFSILQLIYLILIYYELIRYIKLKYNYKDINTYIDNYKNIEKCKKKVVISFTTSHRDLSKIEPMLKSILNQTIRVDKITLNIPYSYKGKQYKIPENYKKFLSVYKVGKYIGQGTSVIPTLTREEEKDTVIIFVKDNVIYSNTFVENLFYESEKYPTNAISCNSKILNDKNGFLVKPNFFKKEVIDYNKKNVTCDWINKKLNCDIKQVDSFNYEF